MAASQGTLLAKAADLIIGKDAIEVNEIDALRYGANGDEEQRREHEGEEGVFVSAYAEEPFRLLHAADHNDRRKHKERDGRHEPRVEVGDEL